MWVGKQVHEIVPTFILHALRFIPRAPFTSFPRSPCCCWTTWPTWSARESASTGPCGRWRALPPPAPGLFRCSSFVWVQGPRVWGERGLEGIFWVLRGDLGFGVRSGFADVSGSSSFWMDGEDCKCAFSKPPSRGLCFRITVRFNDSMRGSQGFCQGFVRVLVRRRESVLLCSSSIVEPCMITYAVSGTPEVPAGAATCLKGPMCSFCWHCHLNPT